MVKLRKRDMKQDIAEPVAPVVIDTSVMESEIAALRREVAALRSKPAPTFEFEVRRDAMGKIASVTASPSTFH